MLSCPICLSSLQSSSSAIPSAITCGHVFCESCLHHLISRAASTSVSAICPQCRTPFDQHDVFRLFLPDADNEKLVPAPPLSEDRIQEIKPMITCANEMGIESPSDELSDMLVKAEAWTIRLSATHGDTDAKATIDQLHCTLQALRNRLRYSARLTSLKAENANLKMENERLKVECDAAMQDSAHMALKLETYHHTATEQLNSWANKDKQRTATEKRLKEALDTAERRRLLAMETLKSKHHDDLASTRKELDLEQRRVLKYKKRYLALLLKADDPKPSMTSRGKRKLDQDDEDLEIISDIDIESGDEHDSNVIPAAPVSLRRSIRLPTSVKSYMPARRYVEVLHLHTPKRPKLGESSGISRD